MKQKERFHKKICNRISCLGISSENIHQFKKFVRASTLTKCGLYTDLKNTTKIVDEVTCKLCKGDKDEG